MGKGETVFKMGGGGAEFSTGTGEPEPESALYTLLMPVLISLCGTFIRPELNR